MRLVRDIGYFLVLCLMILGVGGIMYHAIGKGGWIDRALGGLMHHGFGTGVGVLLAVGVAFWLVRRWASDLRAHRLFSDFLLYGVVGVGLFFAGRLLISGSL